MLSIETLHKQVAADEDSTHQLKADVKNSESLASEMAAFANSEGGTLFIGVADDDTIPGLSAKDVNRINQLISNSEIGFCLGLQRGKKLSPVVFM